MSGLRGLLWNNEAIEKRLEISEKKMEIGNQLADIGAFLESIDELNNVDELSKEQLTRYIHLLESKVKKTIDSVYEI